MLLLQISDLIKTLLLLFEVVCSVYIVVKTNNVLAGENKQPKLRPLVGSRLTNAY